MDTLKDAGSLTSILLCLLLVSFVTGCGNGGEANKKVSAKTPLATQPSKAKVPASQTSATTKKGTEKTANNKAADKKEKPPKPAASKKAKPSEPDVNNEEFHEVLNTAMEEYLRYGMVNSVANQAPELCRPAAEPAPLMSESDDDVSHGQKLYFLFAKDISHYMSQESTPAPVGQTIVKESWSSIESNPNARNLRNHASGNRINPRSMVDGKMMEIGARKNFFIMTKLAKDTPKTDMGWVYGIVDSDSREVIASGKVASCIYCHEDANNDRMFGPANPIETEVIQTDSVGDLPISNEAKDDEDDLTESKDKAEPEDKSDEK